MDELTTIREMLSYNDEMNHRLTEAAKPLTAEQLDEPIEMGPGSLRKTLSHILVAEQVWLERWRGHGETKWPTFDRSTTPTLIGAEFATVAAARDALLDATPLAKISMKQKYRDSAGGEYIATLHEMILQAIVHSTHHRAQAVHMIKRVGGEFVDLDFMYARRRAT